MSAANGGVWTQSFMLMVVVIGSSVEPDNTNGSKSNHFKEGFSSEMRNLTYEVTFTPFLCAANGG